MKSLLIKMKVLVLSFLVFASCLADQTSYENFKVYQVVPRTKEQADILVGFKNFNEDVDFWSELHLLNRSVDIMVSPKLQEIFVKTLENNEIDFSEIISNVERVFQKERLRKSMAKKVENGKINFDEFQRYSVIESYLKQLVKDYPEITELTTPANSTNNRQVYMLKISTGGSNKPIIFIDGGIHAREWISPSTVLYIINQLVENPKNRNLIENVDFLIIPVLNPDGYEYTHTNTRLWRKTRSKGKKCDGVDANRNFDFHWMESGGSSNECSDVYAGPIALSEPEMQAIVVTLQRYTTRIKLYLTVHSCGQYLFYPWSYTSALPENWQQLDELAHKADEAISAVAGTNYTIGSSTNVLYPAAGCSDDYVMGAGGVPLVYVIELPCGGSSGFDPPPSRILPVAVETFEGVKVFAKYVAEEYNKN